MDDQWHVQMQGSSECEVHWMGLGPPHPIMVRRVGGGLGAAFPTSYIRIHGHDHNVLLAGRGIVLAEITAPSRSPNDPMLPSGAVPS